MSKTCVYQAFDTKGTLLYVGLSKHWPSRWMAHAEEKPWWPDIAHLQIQWLPTRRAAEWLEGYWIRTKRPRFNKMIPEPFEAPHDLGVRCDQCPTWYHVSLRLPGEPCEDLSIHDMACQGICHLDGKWECMA